MAEISIKLIQELRERTAAGMMDCKKALQEADGDIEKAIDILRKKGAATAAKRSGKETTEGIVHTYIHPGAKIGVMVEVDCETDFVARTEDLKQFAQDLCLHITAYKPLYVAPENVDEKFLEHERTILKAQLADSGKPDKIIDQIVDGKVKKLYSEICLLNQPWIKDDQITVEQKSQELVAKLGENIKIKRFARYEIGA
ncbi:MAG: translation elongation factor Ts [Candidatus Babeliales bacterium]